MESKKVAGEGAAGGGCGGPNGDKEVSEGVKVVGSLMGRVRCRTILVLILPLGLGFFRRRCGECGMMSYRVWDNIRCLSINEGESKESMSEQ